ncbi:MAG: NADP-dependent oxidoreductase [Candidatus Hydrogenedentes bacterium]|nr:NADP-dependent oxidoreductase [Candidatus Hydrogenedentota bacterium]
MSSDQNTQVVVVELPKGPLEQRHFEVRTASIPEAGDGEVLVRTVYLSLDAANRAWMQGATYTAPVLAGDVMHGRSIGQVVESKDAALATGDYVECDSGWQAYSVHKAKRLMKVTPRGPLSHSMSVYGVSGLTAYFGLLEVGRPKAHETLVVSAAAGAAGNFVAQIGKIKGCHVVGFAGSAKKCAWLKDDLGLDATINYKQDDIAGGLKEACPRGIDVYFDNTGGDILAAVLFQMNLHGRIVCCGAVSQYDTASPAPGPFGIPGLLVVNRIRMEGFIVMDFLAKRAEAEAELAQWVTDGKIQVREDIIEGLENAPQGLIGLLHGDNIGKRMIKVSDE